MGLSLSQLASGNNQLIVAIELPAQSPHAVFACWVEPRLLIQWWPKQAEVEAHPGGSYHFGWPSLEQDLRGVYIAFEPGRRLAFTWKWDHDAPEMNPFDVSIDFEAVNNGTRLTLTHGSYTDLTADQELRLGHHLPGWEYFLPRLAAVQIEGS